MRGSPGSATDERPTDEPERLVDGVLVRNLALYVAHYGVRFVFPLIATPFVAHVLMKDRFADYAIVNSCIWTSTVFMEFGFYLYGVARTGASAHDRGALAAVVSEIAGAKLLLAPGAAAVYLGLTALTGVAWREPLSVGVGLISALGYGASFAWYFQGRQRALQAVGSEAGPQLLQFALLLALVRSPDQLWLVFLLQAIPPVVSLSFALWSIRRDGLLTRVPSVRVRSVLQAASPYFFERICYATYTSVMPSLIALLATKAAVADYSIGDRFGTLMVGLVPPLSQAVTPRVARAALAPDGGWRMSIVVVAFVVGATAMIALVVGAGADWVVAKLFAPEYAGAAVVARVFCLTALCSALSMSVTNFVLAPRGRAKLMFWSGAAALIFGLGAQAMLIPRWGAPGAALGRLAAEASVALVLVAGAVRLYLEQQSRIRLDERAPLRSAPGTGPSRSDEDTRP